MTECPGLLAVIQDLITAVNALSDELRRHHQAEQEDIAAIVALHAGGLEKGR